nr:MAG TPA: DNA binding protein [Caudoviricetes sp.]
MTVSEILQLSAAGFSAAEIKAMGNMSKEQPKDKPKEQPKEPEKKDEHNNDFSAQLAEINKRLDALFEKKEEKPEQKTENTEQKDNGDVLALLQSLNMNSQRYDLPPKYDPEKALAAAYCEVMGGATQEGEKK